QNPNIANVSTSTGVPGNIRQIIVMRVEKDEKISTPAETSDSLKVSNVDSTGNTDTTTFQTGSRMVEHALNFIMIDTNYIDLFDIGITEGRNFDRKMGTDLEEGVIINEATARELGWTDGSLGKKIDFGIDLDGSALRNTKVIGVVKDFHYRSLHNKIDPLLMFLSERPRYFMSIRINEKNQRQTLDYIEEKWNEFGNINPFDYDFLDKTMDEMYEAEENIGRIFRIACVLSIFIALLGLLGLSSFIAEQRTKEIGIRKVLGASIESILKILYKEFVILIIIAFIIASPIAWWILDDWLNTNFIYSTTIGWFSYVLAGLLALVIGLLTISYHIVKAATANPVDSIMCE
ncbi:MAG: FtsX-like permease family protein, partial [Bacteroidales bacterium]|nr:FtsX-like permease family protein [Bacteroidales bacterium]